MPTFHIHMHEQSEPYLSISEEVIKKTVYGMNGISWQADYQKKANIYLVLLLKMPQLISVFKKTYYTDT